MEYDEKFVDCIWDLEDWPDYVRGILIAFAHRSEAHFDHNPYLLKSYRREWTNRTQILYFFDEEGKMEFDSWDMRHILDYALYINSKITCVMD